MKKKTVYLAIVILMATISSCADAGKKAVEPLVRTFPQIQLPSMLEGEQRVDYVAEHFWDRFLSQEGDFLCDSLTVAGVKADEFEGNFATWIGILGNMDAARALSCIDRLFPRLETTEQADSCSNIFSRFSSLMEKYLYDPNSPYRNEDLYGHYAGKLASSELTDPLLKPSYEYTAGLCALNRAGSPAADFRYVDAGGRSHRLYDNKADYTLLFFSNPDCSACKEIIAQLRSIGKLDSLIENGNLAVVNVYIDEDIAAWKAFSGQYPKNWSSGYDPEFSIRESISYNVRAIPSLYLLDAEKKVIMKDAPQEKVLGFINSMEVKKK